MGRKAKYSKELKLEIVKRYLNGESAISLANEYGMTKRGDDSIYRWVHRYESHGESVFDTSNNNKSYSKEFKEQIVKEYLLGETSLFDLINKYEISSGGVVLGWVSKYNNGMEIKNYNPKSEVYTMQARKTTLDERIEIVRYVLRHDNDFKEAADKYSVPYASV